MWPRAVREAEGAENSRLLTGASNSKGLLTRARSEAGRGPRLCAALATRRRERETEADGEAHGEEHGEVRGGNYTHATADTARISQQRCPNTIVPREVSFSTCFTLEEIIQTEVNPNIYPRCSRLFYSKW